LFVFVFFSFTPALKALVSAKFSILSLHDPCRFTPRVRILSEQFCLVFLFFFMDIMCFVINFGYSDKNGGYIYNKFFFCFFLYILFYWLWQFTWCLKKKQKNDRIVNIDKEKSEINSLHSCYDFICKEIFVERLSINQ
jgi:hypothetical protein